MWRKEERIENLRHKGKNQQIGKNVSHACMHYPEEIHRFLSSLVSKSPTIAIIIDEETGEVREASRALKKLGETEVVEFKTYVREDAENVHAHLFESLYEEEEEEKIVATFDREKGNFYCNICGKEDFAVGEINEHLRDEHGISLDDQVIEGWNKKFDKQMNEYFAKKDKGKYPPHRLSWEKRLEWANPSVRTLVAKLICKIEKEFPDVTHLPKYRWYYAYKGKTQIPDSLFAVLMLKKKEIKIRIRTDPKSFRDTQDWTRGKVYKGWFFKKGEEKEFLIIGIHQLDYAMELIKQSYKTSG